MEILASDDSHIDLRNASINLWGNGSEDFIKLEDRARAWLERCVLILGWVDSGISAGPNTAIEIYDSYIRADRISWDPKRVKLLRSIIHRPFILRVEDTAGRPVTEGEVSVMGAYAPWARRIVPEYSGEPRDPLDVLFRYHKVELNGSGEAHLEAFFEPDMTPRLALVIKTSSGFMYQYIDPTSPKLVRVKLRPEE